MTGNSVHDPDPFRAGGGQPARTGRVAYDRSRNRAGFRHPGYPAAAAPEAPPQSEPAMEHPPEQPSTNPRHEPVAGPNPGNRDITVQELLAQVRRHRRTVFAATLVCILAGLAFVLLRDRLYVANTRILIDPLGIRVLERDITERRETGDGAMAVVESQMRVMTSESVLEQVAREQRLAEDPEFAGSVAGLRATLANLWADYLGRERRQPDTDLKVIANFSKAVSASRPQRSYVVDLFVRTKDAEKSARLANAIARTYIESEVEARSGYARRASGMLGARLEELRNELTAAENAVEDYKLANNILDSNGRPINEQELEQLNRLMVEASGRLSLTESNLEQIEAALRSPGDLNNIPEALSSTTISGMRIRLAAAMQQRSILSAELLPSHPSMAAADAQVKVISDQIRQELQRIAGKARAEVDRARSELTQVEQRLARAQQSSHANNDARVRLRQLVRDAEAKRLVYEAFLVRSKELNEQESVDTSQARVISRATPPLHPAGIPSTLILAFAAVSGLAIGVGLALVRGIGFPAAPQENPRPAQVARAPRGDERRRPDFRVRPKAQAHP